MGRVVRIVAVPAHMRPDIKANLQGARERYQYWSEELERLLRQEFAQPRAQTLKANPIKEG